MDIKAYIASGILELYVLGKLDQAQRLEVEANAAQYPEISAEIRAIEEALEAYARLQSVQPPAGTLDDLMKRVGDSKTARPPQSKSINAAAKTNPLWWAFAAISLAIMGWMMWQSGQQNEKIQTLSTELEALKNSCREIDLANQRLRSELLILKNPDNHQIILRGTPLSPEAIASVFYNPAVQKSYLDPINLPLPPENMQYQLWAIVDGAPVDMGVFTIDPASDLLVEVPFITNPAAFAITLEKAGGSPVPTLEQMYVIGNL